MIDDEGFDELYRVARPGVARAVFVVCGDAQLAGEATDEAFVRAYETRTGAHGVAHSLGRHRGAQRGAQRERRRSRRLEQERKAAALETMQHTPAEPSVELWDALRALPAPPARGGGLCMPRRLHGGRRRPFPRRSAWHRRFAFCMMPRVSLATQLISDTDEEPTRGPT